MKKYITQILIWTVIVWLSISIALALDINQDNKKEIIQLEKKLQEAEKPSKLESKKFVLDNMRWEWKTYEDLKNDYLKKAEDHLKKAKIYEAKKLELEPKIRAKESEILGKK